MKTRKNTPISGIDRCVSENSGQTRINPDLKQKKAVFLRLFCGAKAFFPATNQQQLRLQLTKQPAP